MQRLNENMAVQFDFGQNWQNYSANLVDNERINEAKRSILGLLPQEEIINRKILDIGCGSGIFAIAFLLLGAGEVLGTDINRKSINTANENLKYVDDSNQRSKIKFMVDDILNSKILNGDKYDIVYSWGVLHHTGKMYQAIDNALNIVNKDGHCVIAIYNRHWSSPLWRIIKHTYNISPSMIKKILILLFYFIIYMAKLAVTRKNPLNKERGMNFYYDVVDWVGGYPYEYAGKEQIKRYVESKGFVMKKFVKAKVPTGCNEFVFQKSLLHKSLF